MKTPFGEALDTSAVLQEYPRPQLVRDSYINLNGTWEYAITCGDTEPGAWDGTILVPFSPESELSGVQRTLLPGQTLWYRRRFTLPKGFCRDIVLLHFGAVDQDAAAFVNGRFVGEHFGGYNAFSFDITQAFSEGENVLTVRVHDDTDASWRTRGKQTLRRGGIWYTAQSGIWQTVWLESAPRGYIRDVVLAPNLRDLIIEMTVVSDTDGTATVAFAGETHTVRTNHKAALPVRDPHCWSPEDPYLYPYTAQLGEDRVEGYFAMRSFTIEKDGKGVKRFFLNGKPYFQTGLLDQGYYPDGLYTPPSDEAMLADIKLAKDMGFNMLRKHIKVEPMRWYHHCDRLGMIVWQDMPSGAAKYDPLVISLPLVTGRYIRDSRYRLFKRGDAAGREAYRRELTDMIAQLRSVPSIGLWVPFNEGWGQFDSADACALIRALDPARPIDHASGWHDQGVGEIKSLHVYFKKYRFRADKLGRAVALTEFGGYNLREEGHCFNQTDFGYKRFDSKEALMDAYEALYRRQIIPARREGLSATVYTQLSDVEDELNGLVTYDRKVVKLPVERVRALNQELCDWDN